jgi:hypothetical protein
MDSQLSDPEAVSSARLKLVILGRNSFGALTGSFPCPKVLWTVMLRPVLKKAIRIIASKANPFYEKSILQNGE